MKTAFAHPKTLFISMINYMKSFDFATTIFQNHMFKVGLYIFIKIQADVTTYKIYFNLYIKYWIYFIFKSMAPKYTNELLYFS